MRVRGVRKSRMRRAIKEVWRKVAIAILKEKPNYIDWNESDKNLLKVALLELGNDSFEKLLIRFLPEDKEEKQ